VRFSPSGAYLASASADATINIHSTTAPYELLKTLTGHLAGINVLAWSPDSRTIASGSDDKSIRLWDVATGKPHRVPLLGHHNYVYSLAFSPKGNMLVSGSYDEAVFLWDIRPTGGVVIRSLPAHSDPVSGVDFLRDGTMVCSCAGDGLIRIWDTMTGQCLKTLVDEDRKAVASVRWTANGKFVLAWTLDGCVRLWDYREGRCVKTYQGHVNSHYSLTGTMGTYALAGRREAFVASGSEDGDILAWDVSTKEILWRARGHSKVVLFLDFQRGKDGKGMLVSAGLDRTIRLWEECDEVDDDADQPPALVDPAHDYVHAADKHIGRLRHGEEDDQAMAEVEVKAEPDETFD
jgi:COMPASS component SWD3